LWTADCGPLDVGSTTTMMWLIRFIQSPSWIHTT
jgi:hypothetical protein